MKTAKIALLLWAVLTVLCSSLWAWERLDDIVAVVGKKAILASELEFQAQMYAAQMGIKVKNDTQLEQIKQDLLRQMINDRLILLKAMEDTTIKVSDDEVDAAFQTRVDELQSSFRSPEEFEAQLATEGLTFRELKVRLREEVRDQIYKEKLIGKLLNRVSVTRAEVEDFFNSYRDSLPDHPRSVKLARMLLRPASSSEMRDSMLQVAQSLVNRIAGGESFEDLAGEYSDDISSSQGGDIGEFTKGDLLPEFERAALALSPGEVSGVVSTKLGLHIIKLVSKESESFHCKHILLMDHPVAADSVRAEKLAADLTDSLEAGADWGEMVKQFSEDESNKAMLGELGWFAIDDLPPQFQAALTGVDAGGLTRSFWTEEGLQILKVLDRRESRSFSLEEDWDILKEYTRRQKSESVIAAIVNEMKDKVYLELRSQ